MKIPSIITGILASSVLTSGCSQTHTTGECGDPTREEDLSSELMVTDAEDVLQQELALGEPISEADCATLCESISWDDVVSVDACASEWIAHVMTEDTGSGSDTGSLSSEPSIQVDCTATVNVYCLGRRPIGHKEAQCWCRKARPLSIICM